MLSFSGKIHMGMTLTSLNCIIKKVTKSLQVPCSPLLYISKSYLSGKRVLPFISHGGRKRLEGSITVEAAFVLPLFVFFGLAILAPMEWLDKQRQMQTMAERLGEHLSQQAYSADLLDDQGNIQLELMYQEQIPFIFEQISGVTMHVAVKRRGWIGLDGKLTTAMGADGQINQEMVFVTPEGSRYHRYRDCYHLTNVCKAVSRQEVEDLRNVEGKIYYSCSQCLPDQNIQDTVYITTWGVRYHNDRSCAAMSSYFRKVPLSEVIDLGECSVCARRSD